MKEITINNSERLKYGRREAINSLKTNIGFAGTGIKVIEFTSVAPEEGKSTTSFDTARAYASSGSNVLFIDTDLRKSTLVKRFGIRAKGGKNSGARKGLVHYLSGQCDIGEIVCKTNIDGLYMILPGAYSPNPAELLSGERFEELIREMKGIYDVVIIDTPPLGSVIDAAIIAPKCDGTILVVESGACNSKAAAEVVKQLDRTGCKILGCVLNKVPASAHTYAQKYKYKYYGEK